MMILSKKMNVRGYVIRFLVISTLAVCFVSCSSSNNNPTSSNGSSSATLIISINSPLVTPSVKVIGKSNSYNMSSTDTLKGISAGTYKIEANRVDQNSAGGDLVGKSYGILKPVQQITLNEGETKVVNINYSELPASGKLWVSDDNGSRLLAFDKAVLTSPGSPAASIKIQFNYEGPRGIAFDKYGDLWVAGFSKNHIFAFTPGQLSGNVSASPLITLTDNSISGPNGLIFDASGNLWISNWTSGSIIEYSSDSLSNILVKSGSVSAAPDVQINSAKLKEPQYMTFDSYGNLWVAGQDPTSFKGEILKFSPSSLSSSGTVSPSIVITESSQPTLINVTALAFDKSGNLWGTDGNSFFRFSANQLTMSGAVIPQLYRGVPAPALLIGLAFDSQANLWLGETYAPRLIRYTFPDNGSGTTYNTSSDLDEPTWLVFFPPPTGYNIY
jgi:sugar lactone lactonase YvrE